MEHISKTMKEAPKNSVFLYEDESTFRLLPLIRSMWMKVGQQLRIVVPKGRKCALSSLVELEYYIHLTKRLGYLYEDDHRRLDALQDETARVLTGFIRFKEQEAEAQVT